MTHRGAVMAFGGACRMVLERGRGHYAAAWLMCNPSTADRLDDDQTVRRVVKHSARGGYARSLVGNLWPYRTPYPRDLFTAQAGVHVVAFGAVGRRYPQHVAACLEAFAGSAPLYCLGVTADGWPLHPLARGHHFIPADAELRPWAFPTRKHE